MPAERTATNATVSDVAKRAGVSKMTVSRVINGGNGVKPETKRRVERAIAELDFVPNDMARGLMTSKTKTLGLIVPDIVNPFFTMVVHGAETVARRAGYHLLLCNSEADLGQERQYVEHMISHRVEGILIAPIGDRSKQNLALLARRKMPFVLIDRSVAGIKCDLVQSDGVDGARKLVSHLISLGHRRIAVIIEQDDVSTARDRMTGFKEAHAAARLKIAPELVIRTSADRAGGYAAMQQILGVRPPPTAVFAVNNMTALGAMQALRERGLAVPKDIALVCFDDVEHLAVLSPFLTVVNQPTEMFGALSAQLLLDRLASQDAGPRRRIVLPSDLIVRESCGAKAGWPLTPAGRKQNPTPGNQ
jgi:LacI family transcriptional regulator